MQIDIQIYIFAVLNLNLVMDKLKTKTVMKMLEDEGWYIARQKGSHRQYKHPTKKGTVTINGKPNEVQQQFLLNSIFKQAGWL